MLLTAFSEPLANALSRKLKVLAVDEPPLLERVTVASFRGIAEELYTLAFGRKAHSLSATSSAVLYWQLKRRA